MLWRRETSSACWESDPYFKSCVAHYLLTVLDVQSRHSVSLSKWFLTADRIYNLQRNQWKKFLPSMIPWYNKYNSCTMNEVSVRLRCGAAWLGDRLRDISRQQSGLKALGTDHPLQIAVETSTAPVHKPKKLYTISLRSYFFRCKSLSSGVAFSPVSFVMVKVRIIWILHFAVRWSFIAALIGSLQANPGFS